MVESMLEVVESLLALLRILLAVVERLLAPSFSVSAKIRSSRRAWSPTKKYSKDETTHCVVLRVRWWVGLVVRFV